MDKTKGIETTIKKEIWFKSKSYGWGWTPVTWQGWTITATYSFIIAGLIYSYLFYMNDVVALDDIIRNLILLLVFISIVTGCMVFICYRYGENPGKFKLWKS